MRRSRAANNQHRARPYFGGGLRVEENGDGKNPAGERRGAEQGRAKQGRAQNHPTCWHTLRQNQGHTLEPALSTSTPSFSFTLAESPRSTKEVTGPRLVNGASPFPTRMGRALRLQRPSLGPWHIAEAQSVASHFLFQIVTLVAGRDKYSPYRNGEKAGERGEHEQVRQN